jgi:fatty-acyl-CoA synthase
MPRPAREPGPHPEAAAGEGGTTFGALLHLRALDDHAGLAFEDERYSWADVVQASATRCSLARELLQDARPAHVGLLLENVPEFVFWIGAAALGDATIVAINPTRRGHELARDIQHTDCGVIITDTGQASLLDRDDLGGAPVLIIESSEYGRLIAEHSEAPVPTPPHDDGPVIFTFTSGSASAPKAVPHGQRRLAALARDVGSSCDMTRDSVAYMSMPLFHGNSLTAAYPPMVASGGTIAMRRRFSASGFLPDIRRYGATHWNYVGRAMAYVNATPERADDADNPLRLAFGAEASPQVREEFVRRFGCDVLESYGGTEGEFFIKFVPGTPRGALGKPPPGQEVAIVNPDTGERCQTARFDTNGILVNAHEAVGQIVGLGASHRFPGYYKNPEAAADRIRGADVWTGDLGYRDDAGFFYYAGRTADWIRVDAENFSAAPIERILLRMHGIVVCAVYAVPDPSDGDQVMAAFELDESREFDPAVFVEFLRGQRDLGTKWAPRFVRIAEELPRTGPGKLDRTPLRRDGWRVDDPVWWRPGRELDYMPFTPHDRAELERAFAAHGRSNLLVRS